MFVEHINKDITFYDDDKIYTYDDLVHYVKCAQFKIKSLLTKPSIVGFCSHSSFFEMTTILAFLELGHKILFIPKKHVFYYDIYDGFFDVLDLIVDSMDSNVNSRNILTITQDELYYSSECDEIVLETDDLKTGFVFLSSGTTGKPKIIEQTHRRLLHATQQTIERIWVNNRNFLLHRGNTINHLGIFTTTYLPALFMGENVSWCNHKYHGDKLVSLNSDIRLIYNSILIFPYQPVEILNKLPLSNNVKIITGGSSLTEEFISEIFKNKHIESIYNVYGATEIITPLMWNQINKTNPNRLFNNVLDGLTVNVNLNGEVETINGFVDTDDRLYLPDTIRVVNKNNYEFISRKCGTLFRNFKKIDNAPLTNKVHNMTLTEDQFIGVISERLGNFETPLPIVLKKTTTIPNYFEHYLVYDSKKHDIINETSLEEINNIVYLYYGVHSSLLDMPFINGLVPINNLSDFNNGLKLDRGLIRKTINNKINKEDTKIL